MSGTEYHKINGVYKRDERGRFIKGEFAVPEFGYLFDRPWLWTEKVDGTNIRVQWLDGVVSFGGRTDRAQLPAKLVQHLQETFTAEKMAEVFAGDAVLYGEGFGAGIQMGGGNYGPEQRFIGFDVFCGGVWLLRDAVEEICEKLKCPVVPVVFRSATLDYAEAAAMDGIGSALGNFEAEGVVGVPCVPLLDRMGRRIVCKVKCKDYRQ